MMTLFNEKITRESMNDEATKEKRLINGPDNLFGIYQLKDGEATRDYRFEPFNLLIERGLKIERQHYKLVYIGNLPIRDRLTSLGTIFQTFNLTPPADFTGHSLSVSDVVVLQWRGKVSAHYVDTVGFKDLPFFLSNEAAKE
jgi:hypothetical protein